MGGVSLPFSNKADIESEEKHLKKAEKNQRSAAVRIVKPLRFVEDNFMIITTAFVGFAIMIDIIFRFLGIPGLFWVEEFGRYMLVTTTMIGCSIAVGINGHSSMDLLYKFIPDKLAYVLKIIVNLLCMVLFFYTSYYAMKWTMVLHATNRTMDSIGLPTWPIWAIVTAAFFTTGIRFLSQGIGCVKRMIGNVPFNEFQMKEM